MSNSSALLLAADDQTRLFFKANDTAHGITEQLSFRAWDQTSGNAGKVNPGAGGGNSAQPERFPHLEGGPLNNAPSLSLA